jgi:hypothetical protein
MHMMCSTGAFYRCRHFEIAPSRGYDLGGWRWRQLVVSGINSLNGGDPARNGILHAAENTRAEEDAKGYVRIIPALLTSYGNRRGGKV